jgi:lactate dehydrogenase-like 2-hydroxyacid dehydrogenase
LHSRSPGASDNRPNRERKEIDLALTAGIGSDHVDLKAAAVRSHRCGGYISADICVAEHVAMMDPSLARNNLPAYRFAVNAVRNCRPMQRPPTRQLLEINVGRSMQGFFC